MSKGGEQIGWPSLDDGGSSSQDEQAASPSAPKDTGSLEAVVVEKMPLTVSVSNPSGALTKDNKVSSSSSLNAAKTDTAGDNTKPV